MKKRKGMGGGSDQKFQKILVGRRTAAEMVDTSPGYLANLASQGRGPRMYKAGTKALYKVDELLAYFTSHPVETIDSFSPGRGK